MMTQIWSTFLYILNYFDCYIALGHNKQNTELKIVEESPLECQTHQVHEFLYLENWMDGTRMKLSYIQQQSLKVAKGFPVSSVCLRCNACIAIAEKVIKKNISFTILTNFYSSYSIKEIKETLYLQKEAFLT